MSFGRAVLTVGGMTVISRLAGFGRDLLSAAILGAGPAADAFFVALKLPNFLRRLFAEGAFSVSFVPLYAAELEQAGQTAADRFARQALGLMLLVLLPLTALAWLGMPELIRLLAPGFAGDAERLALAVELARITFPYLTLVSLVALLGGVLNAHGRFAAFAAAPVAFNLTLIGALVLAALAQLVPARTLAWGVAVAGVVQLALLAWACRRAGLCLRPRWPTWSPPLRQLLRLMGPGAIGTGVMQITLVINVVLATLLPAGAVSYLYYADRLSQLPLGVVGIAIGTALLPLLSRHAAAGNQAEVCHYTSRGLELALLLGLPAALALALAGPTIVAGLFQRGAFGPAESAATAAALTGFAAAIPAYMVTKVLSTLSYARRDTVTPVVVAALAALANAGLALALMPALAHVGIAAATGLSAWLGAGLLALTLARRGGLHLDQQCRRRLPRIALASAGMGAGLVALQALLAPWSAGPGSLRLLALALLVGGGLGLYAALAQALGATRLQELRGLLRERS